MKLSSVLFAAAAMLGASMAPSVVEAGCADSNWQADGRSLSSMCGYCITEQWGFHIKGKGWTHKCSWDPATSKCSRLHAATKTSTGSAGKGHLVDPLNCEKSIVLHVQPGERCEPLSVWIVRHGKVDNRVSDLASCVRFLRLNPQGKALAHALPGLIEGDAASACPKLAIYAEAMSASDKKYKKDSNNRAADSGAALAHKCNTEVKVRGSDRIKLLRNEFQAGHGKGGKSLVILSGHSPMIGRGKDDIGHLESWGFDIPYDSWGEDWDRSSRDYTQNNLFHLKVDGDCKVTRTVVPLTGNKGEGGGTYPAWPAFVAAPADAEIVKQCKANGFN